MRRREVLALYDGESRGTRLHTAVRWRTCPFEAVAAAVPARGRILEIGCGHGLFSALLALQRRDRIVVGTDVDGDKIHAAQRAAQRASERAGAHLEFAPSDPGALPPGPWDAVAIVDVLYLIDPEGSQSLIAAAAGQLSPGGVLLVKEMARRPAWKFQLMRLQEQLSVRVLGITEGDNVDFASPETIGGWMAAAGLDVEHQPLHGRSLYPHHLVIGRAPAA